MAKIQIFTDTGSDMTDELANEGVKIVPLYITFDGKTSLKQMVDIKLPEFYERMRSPHDMHPKTSLASIQDYYDLFEEDLKDGKDVKETIQKLSIFSDAWIFIGDLNFRLDLTYQDNSGNSYLHLAIIKLQENIVKLLIEKGINY